MGRNEYIYEFKGSGRSSIYITGHVNGYMCVWDVTQRRIRLAELQTSFSHTAHFHLAVSDDGQCIAAGEFYSGVELWDWRTQRRLWTRDIREVQRLSFYPGGHDMLVETDRKGLYVLRADDGSVLETVRGVTDVVLSPFGNLMFAKSRKRLLVIDRDSGRKLVNAEPASFGVLAACFTPRSVVVSETGNAKLGTGPTLRAFSLADGREILRAPEGHHWTAFMKLGAVEDSERVVAWASVQGDPVLAPGELVELDLDRGTVRTLMQKPWIGAVPLLSGRAWVFGDHSVEHVA